MARLAFIVRRGGVSLLLTAVAATVAVAAPGHAPAPRLRLSFLRTGVQAAPTATATPALPAPVIAMPAACARGRLFVRLSPPAGASVRRVDVKVGRARANRYKPGRSLSLRVRGRARVKVSVRLSDARLVSATRGYRC